MTGVLQDTAGVDFTANTSTANFTPGQTVIGSDGTFWQYVYAGSTINQYDWVTIGQTNSSTAVFSPQAYPLTITNGGLYNKIGIAQVAITSAFYGWVAVNGANIKGHIAASAQPGAFLYATATAGVADITVSSAAGILGAVAMSSATSSSSVYVIITFPHLGFLRAA